MILNTLLSEIYSKQDISLMTYLVGAIIVIAFIIIFIRNRMKERQREEGSGYSFTSQNSGSQKENSEEEDYEEDAETIKKYTGKCKMFSLTDVEDYEYIRGIPCYRKENDNGEDLLYAGKTLVFEGSCDDFEWRDEGLIVEVGSKVLFFPWMESWEQYP